MPATTFISWADLFHSSSPPDLTLKWRVLKKSGQPFLLLPLSGSLAAPALSLYPAQTGFAKTARASLFTALRARLPLPFSKASIAVSRADPFPRFLTGLVGGKAQTFPALAILAGNPRAAGRRFLILVFDEQGGAAFAVKAGIGESARQLIRDEISFLRSAPPGRPGLPELRASFDAGRISALAMDYVAGDSPTSEDAPAMVQLLSAWLNRAKQIRIQDTLAWQALEQTASADPVFRSVAEKLAGFSFHAAIMHGDFAPWNIKVSSRDGSWKILDWERGEMAGIPGWDWFHYVIQKGVLVRRQTPAILAQKMEQLFGHAPFQNYARVAGIAGKERVLALAYLLHLIKVVRPSEGLTTNQALLLLLGQRWLA